MMTDVPLSVWLGGAAALIACCLLSVVLLFLRHRLRRRQLAQQKERRCSIRVVKRHPLHPPMVGVPVQPGQTASMEPHLLLDPSGRRRSQPNPQEQLRVALSKSMEHLVFEPGMKPTYTLPVAGGTETNTEQSASPSELSSATSDEESKSQVRRVQRVRPRMEFDMVYTGTALTVAISRVLNQPDRYVGRPLLVRLTVLGHQVNSQPIQEGQTQLVTFPSVPAGWLEQGQLTCHLYFQRRDGCPETVVGEGSVRLGQLHLASGTLVSCNVVFRKIGRRKTIR